MTDAADFFRGRLDQMIDLRHPLAVLPSRMPWQEIEASLAQQFARRVREGNRIEGVDLFGPSVQIVGAGLSKAGRPRLPMRLMISLLYLKHAFDESDEGVVDRWGETPSWQYFSGMDYYEHRRACDPTVLVKFRKLLGEQGVEELLAQTINAAVNLKLIDRQHLTNVIVDSTVAPKAVAYPTDSRLLETAREKLVAAAKDQGIALKQTYAKEGSYLRHKAGRYAHARQFKRMRRMIKRQRTIVGRLARQIQTKVTTLTTAIRETLGKANRLFEQTAKRKTETPKLHSCGRQAACGAARGGLQHSVAAADDSCERPAGLVTCASGYARDGCRRRTAPPGERPTDLDSTCLPRAETLDCVGRDVNR